jgi:hypothetical protein
MHRNRATVLILAVVLLAGACEQEVEIDPVNDPGKLIRPQAARAATEQAEAPEPDSHALVGAEEVRISIERDHKIVQVLNLNLDLDQYDEQVVVLKWQDDPESLIHVLVADFDTVRNSWVHTWTGTTQATDIRSFTIFFEDVVGDHNLEIACSGMNSAGEQTLSVFRKTRSPVGYGLYYTTIADITSDGTIEIQYKDRSQAYQMNQRNGVSFPIVAYASDPDSGNIMDLIQITYNWRFQNNRYVETRRERIAGEQIEEQQLKELFRSDAAAFEQFLSGPWYRVDTVDEGYGYELGDMILFDPDARRMYFYSGGVQEIYVWTKSDRTIFRGLYISTHNEAISFLRRQVRISVRTLDTIQLEIHGTEEWRGTYRKLTPGLQAELLHARRAEVHMHPVELQGLYKSDDGMEIFFAPPRFTLTDGDRELHGGFATFRVESEILQLKAVRRNGLVQETRTYRIEYNEEKDETRILRTLVLQPGELGVYGFVPSLSDPIKLDQIEILEDTDEEQSAAPAAE